MSSNTELHDYFKYSPSTPAAIVVGALYTIVFIVTFVQWIRYRAWVWLFMVLPNGMEAAGYIIRVIATKHVYDKTYYVPQYVLIVLAPVIMAAACYIVFGRILFHIVPKEDRKTSLLWIPPRFVTPIFVTGDIIALFLQLIGAVMITSVGPTTSNPQDKLNTGKNIALIGTIVQLVFFGFFSIVAVRFNFTSKRFSTVYLERTEGDEKYVMVDGREKKLKKNWQALLRTVNFATLMILIRTIYRLVDFEMGHDGFLETHEWVIYVFDALPIFPCFVLFTYFHPGKYLPYLGFTLPKHAR